MTRGCFEALKKAIFLIFGNIPFILTNFCIKRIIHLFNKSFKIFINRGNTICPIPINFINFLGVNENLTFDRVFYIKIDNTNIDYPILYPNDKSNDYYLRKNIKGEYDSQGVIWIENYNDPDWSDPVTVVYGHNIWTKGTRFYQLKKFRDENFFEKNRFIQIYAEGRELKYEIYSAFEYDDRHIMLSYNFLDDKVYQEFIDYTLNPLSLSKNVRKNTVVTTNDKLIVLSTCIKGKENMRYLVVGVQREDVKTK